MKTCGTCKFRGEQLMKYDNATGEDIPTSFFKCGRVKFAEDNEGLASGMKAATQDGSGYMAKLCVEDDFGCTLWEPKP